MLRKDRQIGESTCRASPSLLSRHRTRLQDPHQLSMQETSCGLRSVLEQPFTHLLSEMSEARKEELKCCSSKTVISDDSSIPHMTEDGIFKNYALMTWGQGKDASAGKELT